MSDLTDAAKAEIKAAIAIIREDRFEKFVRGRTPKPADPPADPPKPNDPPVTPPPPADPPKPNDPPTDPPTGRKSAYWGEIFDS